MPGILRQNIHRGPGAAVFGDVTIHDADGITAEIDQGVQEIAASMSGPLDSIATDRQGKISLTPCGQLAQDILGVLFPHQTPQFGSSLYGAGGADVPLKIFGLDGRTLEFFNAALTGIPEIRLSAVRTAFGRAEWTALPADGKLPGEAGFFCASGAAPYDKGYPCATGIAGHAYSVSWGGIDITDMTGDGAAVTFDLGADNVTTDRVRTIDKTLSSLAVRATLTPYGVSAADLLAMRGVNAAPGASLAGGGDLVVTSATGLVVVLAAAALVSGPCQWGASALRVGQLGFAAHRRADGLLYSVSMA
jgi:hypothetical protein